MKTNSQTLLALTAALALLCGCATDKPSKPAKATAEIRKIITADLTVHGRVFTNQPSARPPASAATLAKHYAAGLRTIPMSKSPRDFEIAYLEHIQAWEAFGDALERQPNNGDLSTLLGIAAGIYTGQPQLAIPGLLGGANNREQATKRFTQEKQASWDRVRESWNKIELLALQHDVRVNEILPKP